MFVEHKKIKFSSILNDVPVGQQLYKMFCNIKRKSIQDFSLSEKVFIALYGMDFIMFIEDIFETININNTLIITQALKKLEIKSLTKNVKDIN